MNRTIWRTPQPERVERMAAMWQAWAERAHVLPLNPGSEKTKANKKDFNHKQTRFEFKTGDDVDRFKAPYVQGRAFSRNRCRHTNRC